MTQDELLKTLGDKDWLKVNEDKIKNLYPETWTHQENIINLQLMYHLKLIGLNWKDNIDLANILAFFENIKFVLRNGDLIKRNPDRLFY